MITTVGPDAVSQRRDEVPISLRLDQEIPPEIEIGEGAMLVLSGSCHCAEAPVNGLAIGINGRFTEVRATYELRPEFAVAEPTPAELVKMYSGFWVALPLDPEDVDRLVDLRMRITLHDGRVEDRHLGNCTLVRRLRHSDQGFAPAATASKGLVAVCMCTFEPDPHRFRRQIESIRAQSVSNWICIVCDDGSSDARVREIVDVLGSDSRFRLIRHGANVGFYRNFERCLRMVPGDAEFVALSDQDDYWYPAKLETLLGAIGPGEMLAYCDMRIVDARGLVVSPTYWRGRRNEYHDLAVVLLANTVTGAASIFRAELLKHVLPFPTRIGDAFHDHWIACVAMTRGRIRYVDQPLYDYFQYGDSIIGHCDFQPWTAQQRVISVLRNAAKMCLPRTAKPLLRRLMGSSLAVYRFECRRLELIAATLLHRGVDCVEDRRVLGMYGRGFRSGLALLREHGRILAQGKTTDDAELRLAMGYFSKWVEERRARRHRNRMSSSLAGAF